MRGLDLTTKVHGIPDEAKTIEVLSFSWGAGNPVGVEHTLQLTAVPSDATGLGEYIDIITLLPAPGNPPPPPPSDNSADTGFVVDFDFFI